MKKMLAGLWMVLGGVALCRAGTPIDQGSGTPMQGPYSNTSIQGSTFTATSPNVSIAAPVCSNGAAGRNCFTKNIVQISTAAIFYMLDAGTTIQYVQGIALSGSSTGTGANTITLAEPHLEPFCARSGDAVTLSIVGTSVAGINNVINYEGYTNCGPGNNAGL